MAPLGRRKEHQHFIDCISLREADTLPRDKEFPANQDEVVWWKQHQVKRALRKCTQGTGTLVDLSLVVNKTNIVPSAATRERIKQRL